MRLIKFNLFWAQLPFNSHPEMIGFLFSRELAIAAAFGLCEVTAGRTAWGGLITRAA